MARFSKHLLLLTSYILLLTSCQEGGEAGDLFGQWRMNGSDSEYLSFSGSIAVFSTNTKVGTQVFGNFQHVGDSLIIQCYSKGLPSDTTLVEQLFGFKPFSDIRVRITTLDADRLVLTKEGQTWEFFKY
jgi:hypothetical protein